MADVGEHGSGQESMDERSSETKTILFADVVDSTGLYDELGDQVARRLLVQCLELMSKVVEECKGAATVGWCR